MRVLILYGDFYVVSNLPIEKFSYLRFLEVEAYNTEAKRCALVIETAYNQPQHEDNGFNVSAVIFKGTRKYAECNIISVIYPVITSFTTRFNVFCAYCESHGKLRIFLCTSIMD